MWTRLWEFILIIMDGAAGCTAPPTTPGTLIIGEAGTEGIMTRGTGARCAMTRGIGTAGTGIHSTGADATPGIGADIMTRGTGAAAGMEGRITTHTTAPVTTSGADGAPAAADLFISDRAARRRREE